MGMQLIRAKTSDGLLLDGCLQTPEVQAPLAKNTAWLLIHGTGSNFYCGGVLERFAERLVQENFAALRINTRGHDIISTSSGGKMPLSGGAAFESIADCVHDVRAWIDELVQLGFQQVVVVGHSMGGVKAIFSQAHDPHPNVVAVTGVSPPRFCHAVWQSSPKAVAFRDHFQRATELTANGRGGDLMLVQKPMPLWLTAAGFLAKYGPHDDYDFVPLLPRLKVPTLIVIGSESIVSSPAFDSTPDAIGHLQGSNPHLTFRLVPGANIVYSGQVDVPACLACDWFASVVNLNN